MADSDGSPNQDHRHHRRSRSCSPVSPEWTGETPAEREERRLAEAAGLVLAAGWAAPGPLRRHRAVDRGA